MKYCSIVGHLANDDIDIQFVEYGHSEEAHIHDVIEIAFFIDGQGENVINNESIRSRCGTIIMMDYNCVHDLHV